MPEHHLPQTQERVGTTQSLQENRIFPCGRMNSIDLLCPEDQALLFQQIKINRELLTTLMIIPTDKKAQEEDTGVLLLKPISATDLARRLCCDHHARAKQNLAPAKLTAKIKLHRKNHNKGITYFSQSTSGILKLRFQGTDIRRGRVFQSSPLLTKGCFSECRACNVLRSGMYSTVSGNRNYFFSLHYDLIWPLKKQRSEEQSLSSERKFSELWLKLW